MILRNLINKIFLTNESRMLIRDEVINEYKLPKSILQGEDLFREFRIKSIHRSHMSERCAPEEAVQRILLDGIIEEIKSNVLPNVCFYQEFDEGTQVDIAEIRIITKEKNDD